MTDMRFLIFFVMIFCNFLSHAHEIEFNNGSEQEYTKAASLKGDVREIQAATEGLWPRIGNGSAYEVSENDLSITENNNFLIYNTNNLPDHELTTTNPNCAIEKSYKFLIPKNPKKLAFPVKITSGMQKIGIALNGVVIAGPYDSQNKIAPYNRTVDQCSSHADPQGMYHYHFAPLCMKDKSGEEFATNPSEQIGWSFDGYQIHGLADRKIHLPEIDICNGHKHGKGYHYHATRDFPFFMSCYVANPQTSNFTQKNSKINNLSASCSGLMVNTLGSSGGNQKTSGKEQQVKNGNKGKRPNFENAASVLNLSEKQLKKALGPPPGNIDKASKELNILKSTLLEALQLN